MEPHWIIKDLLAVGSLEITQGIRDVDIRDVVVNAKAL